MKKNNYIIIFLGTIAVYFLWKSTQNQDSNNLNASGSMRQLNFDEFIPQIYPLIQHNMIKSIIDLTNSDIKRVGVQGAIFETQKKIKVLQSNNPTEIENELINLYGDIIMKLKR
jgi:hypothetical protein